MFRHPLSSPTIPRYTSSALVRQCPAIHVRGHPAIQNVEGVGQPSALCGTAQCFGCRISGYAVVVASDDGLTLGVGLEIVDKR